MKKKNKLTASASEMPTGTRQKKDKTADNQSAYSASSIYTNPINYVQIGCLLFLVAMRPDAFGHLMPYLMPWTFSQLKKDFAGKLHELDNIPRYLTLGCFPCNIMGQYQREVTEFYNTYAPPTWTPSPGEWPHINAMIRHIFGKQFELGLDYLQLLFTRPKQILPILVLVSRERATGKTTFLNLLKEIFGANMAFVTNETMRSRFNAERASKLIVACDEAVLNKKEDSERLKALSTARSAYIEFKGKDRYEIENFAKIILCSNNIHDPVYIDAEEIRYWVIEVSPLTEDDPDILDAMKKEIPAFLDSLLRRQLSVPAACSRMWFAPEDLKTPALTHIIRVCRPSAELELAEFMLDIMDQYNVNELRYTSSDLNSLLRQYGRDINNVHHIISKVWCVPHAANKMAYDLFAPWVDMKNLPSREYGRYYVFARPFLLGLVPEAAAPASSGPEPEEKTGSLF